MEKDARILVAGGRGMVGAAITRRLQADGFRAVLAPDRAHLDLLDTRAVDAYFDAHRPEYVFMAAARVGGILANATRPADFIYENLVMTTNVVHAAFVFDVRKLLFLGSTCIYPKMAPQPLREEYLLTGPLEATNDAYAVAKIAGIKLCEAYQRQYGRCFISAMPTNLYGPHDNFNLETAHVLPALMRRFHEATQQGLPSVTVWGSGTPLREFLHVDDCASACVFLMHHHAGPEIVNIGTGDDLPIARLADIIQRIVGYPGAIVFDASKPDGTPRKRVDTTRINRMGWHPSIDLESGLAATYAWFREALDAHAALRL